MFSTTGRKITPSFAPTYGTVSVCHANKYRWSIMHHAKRCSHRLFDGGSADKNIYFVDLNFHER
jgi:hypothetical protein